MLRLSHLTLLIGLILATPLLADPEGKDEAPEVQSPSTYIGVTSQLYREEGTHALLAHLLARTVYDMSKTLDLKNGKPKEDCLGGTFRLTYKKVEEEGVEPLWVLKLKASRRGDRGELEIIDLENEEEVETLRALFVQLFNGTDEERVSVRQLAEEENAETVRMATDKQP